MIEFVSGLARNGRVRVTLHARAEMDADAISTDDLLAALSSPKCELGEYYPDDPRGHSHLLLGWTAAGDAIHACCAVHEGELVVITVYSPNPALWSEDWRKRK